MVQLVDFGPFCVFHGSTFTIVIIIDGCKNAIVKAAFELQSACVKSTVVRCIYSTESSNGFKSYKVVAIKPLSLYYYSLFQHSTVGKCNV